VTVVVDTGVLLGAADADDKDHVICTSVLYEHRGGLLVPAPVVPEVAWQIERNLGPRSEASFLDLIIDGELEVADLSRDGYRRCRELVDQYADLGLGLVDASVVTVAEARNVITIATLNRRDFAVVRPRDCEAFALIP
jgi:uncharacterized protein